MIPTLLAIIGPSGSGKSDLALELAQILDAEIVSLDSLSVYQEINIAAAKPSLENLACIKHYGIDILRIDQKNNAQVFKQEVQRAIATTTKKKLLLVGGSSFYLKALIDGLSPMPILNKQQEQEIQRQIAKIDHPHAFLARIDSDYASYVKDTYRITQGLKIYLTTHMPPSAYFKAHPKIPFKYPIQVYGLCMDKTKLHANIAKRTKTMLNQGIVEEIKGLADKYGTKHQPFKAIGPKECLQYLRGELSYQELYEMIYTHTCQLAKRQMTFNRSQFKEAIFLDKEHLKQEILEQLSVF
ncbi:tRNA (adenosine(37)-N6)-dimethylallyltransferase MiaA [Helicobacter suis]|uniref:tRNA (adenosine(37)-N6)-dimethylallyltransferase MiaA n=1 Tax=Helicobacter suis TaxID=104628 RepID=UPI001596953B|nr:tRNA (adenosine(37)-N6)-dimethylallyltransferase MiaA [Helicobacter suis]BCD50577.1 tRNA delta(2)-isopentenylpyrophosphate transferase MiaA [Helicobacter suis]